MAKKQFIRHLEYYGFPDQNGYSSNIGNMDVDLSELKKKDKEHDKEIKGLENEKANKKDLLDLSGTVENFIDTQSQVNRTIVNELVGITADIDTLKEVDNQYGEQLSGLTDGVNEALSSIQTINRKVNNIKEDLAELSGKVETFSAETQEKFDGISEELDNKADKDELDRKADKDELDNFVSKEWVEEQGYLTLSSGDSRYVKIGDIEEISGAVTDLSDKVDAISGDVAELSSTTEGKINELIDDVDEISGKVDSVSASVGTFDDRITQNANDIDVLEDEMERKANKADLEVLETTVSNLSDLIDGKVSKVDFETYKGLVNNRFIDMDDKKLDKTAFTEAISAIEDTNDRIDQEIANRISGDTYIQNQIYNINSAITEIVEQGVDYGDRIQDLEEELAQEIADREQADLDLIGHETDPYDADTIWGAKNFAKNQKNQAITEANLYTDGEIAGLRTEFENDFNEIEQELSGKASKEYVDEKVNEAKTQTIITLESEINAEKTRAEAEENNLLARIIQNRNNIELNKTAIDHNANSIHTITAWDAAAYDYDPAYYDNSGNGILDVLHREFHEYVEKDGIIESITYDNGYLIIKYKTTEGEKTTTIPIGDIVDLSDYYKKEEVDEKLSQKADTSALTEIIESLDDNTEAIAELSGKVETFDDKIDDEISRATSAEDDLRTAINNEIQRATNEENTINTRIDNLILECGIY